MLNAIKSRLKRNRKIYLILAPVFGLYRGTMMRLARLRYGVNGNRAVFSSFEGRSYNDNPRYISEKLHQMRPETEIIWLMKEPETARKRYPIPDYVKIFNTISRKGVCAEATARVLVDNYVKRSYLKLDMKRQFYIQTWHGDRAFKKVGFDTPGYYKTLLETNASLGVTGSDYGDRQFRSAFHYKGELLKAGYPRNDILVRNDPAERDAVREKLGIEKGTRVLLYAPTFRDVIAKKHEQEKPHLDPAHLAEVLEKKTGEKWIALIRAHYISYGLESTESELVKNVSDYPEMAELLLLADALVTDYSSCAGDFALTRRPIWLYQDDLEEYKSSNRQLYFNMEDSPYMVASTPEEMDRLIESTTAEAAKKNCGDILAFYGEAETGHAAERVCEIIIEKLNNSDRK